MRGANGRRVAALGLAGALAVGGGAAAGAPPPAPRWNLLLISVDTLRADHLGCYGYFRATSPVIDGLAAQGTLFELALTPMATTLPAHTSLLTGTQPAEHGVLANLRAGLGQFTRTRGLRSFAEHARERGYRTAGFVSGAPLASATGIAAGFEVYSEPAGIERGAAETNAEFFAWLSGRDRRPFFVFLHYFDPHAPYLPPAPHDAAFADGPELAAHMAERQMLRAASPDDPVRAATAAGINGYDGEIRYVDAQLGEVFARLRAAGLAERTVTVLLSDHGEGFGEHGLAGHGFVHREQIHVPWIVHVPGAAPRRVRFPVSLIDVLPTLVGLLGEREGAGWRAFLEQAAGRDVLAAGPRARPVLSQRVERLRPDLKGPAFSLVAANWKLLHQPWSGDKLFDWTTDPWELTDRAGAEGARVAELRAAVKAALAADDGRRRQRNGGQALPPRTIDPALLEKLEALGYAE